MVGKIVAFMKFCLNYSVEHTQMKRIESLRRKDK